MRKNVLVTGSSRGIGKSIAIEFAKNGYDVIINYNLNEIEAKKALEEVSKYNDNSIIVKCDISNEDEVKEMSQIINEKYGKLDSLINNAAVANDSIFLDKSKEDFMNVYETNLIGPFLCTKYLSSLMNDNSSIVNISSTNGIDTYYPYSADYDASKAALISLSNNIAVELAPIRVNTVCPGWVNTDMNKELDLDYVKSEEEKILLKRFAEPEEIAKTVLFLCSDNASYINKSIIRVDGGFYE
ncbi:MAG: SDR family oxidoreductase [Bacilli bacterium]|nr:SDR family oxidoreductase [Bacilli bacterium]